MFICKTCSKDFEIRIPLQICLLSYGPCEVCRKVKTCYDVPHNAYTRIRSSASSMNEEEE